jgi:ribosomal protein L22
MTMDQPNIVSHAVARFVRMSPQKSRLVADLIRDRYVGEALKRIRPAPQGRAYRVLKRTSHVHIYLEEKGR